MPDLPYDYARCLAPGDCPHAAVCLRNTPGREWYQPYTRYTPGEDCEGLITPQDWRGRYEVPA